MIIKAVIFDLDGVITDTAEYHYIAWKKLGEEIGISFDREFNEQLKGISRMDSLNRILAHGNKLSDFTEEEKEFLATKKNEHYKELITHITPADVLPGVLPFLQQLNQQQLKTAIASASKNAATIIGRLGIGQYFDVIIDAATVQHGKPHPEVFLKAADALGIPYEECVGIEDAAAGVEAINAAGMYSIGIGQKDILCHANIVLETTDELKNIQFLVKNN